MIRRTLRLVDVERREHHRIRTDRARAVRPIAPTVPPASAPRFAQPPDAPAGARARAAGPRTRAAAAPARGVRITARSMACCSSRTLPGHGYALQQLERVRRDARDLLPDLRRRAHREAIARAAGCPPAARAAAGSRSGSRSVDSRGPAGTCPAAASAARSRLVVAMMRTSTRIGDVPPTRSNSCSCSTRSSLACRSSRISEISSSSSVPPCARSNAPSTRLIAPVNAPFSWPNSALSISPSGSAAQFSLMNGLSRRSLWSWIARANSSLPVPLSPCSSTVARVGAAIATVCRMRRIAGAVADDLPLVPELHHLARAASRSRGAAARTRAPARPPAPAAAAAPAS